jgi:hypothetical protein
VCDAIDTDIYWTYQFRISNYLTREPALQNDASLASKLAVKYAIDTNTWYNTYNGDWKDGLSPEEGAPTVELEYDPTDADHRIVARRFDLSVFADNCDDFASGCRFAWGRFWWRIYSRSTGTADWDYEIGRGRITKGSMDAGRSCANEIQKTTRRNITKPSLGTNYDYRMVISAVEWNNGNPRSLTQARTVDILNVPWGSSMEE